MNLLRMQMISEYSTRITENVQLYNTKTVINFFFNLFRIQMNNIKDFSLLLLMNARLSSTLVINFVNILSYPTRKCCVKKLVAISDEANFQ